MSQHRHQANHRRQFARKQAGVAVVTALLLTTLAVTIVASLFWQQQVQVRSIENQRLQAQKKWITRGVLSFSRLAVNLGTRSAVNYPGEPWAQPIKDFRLSDFMAAGYRESADVDPILSGQLSDAQGRFNLANLAGNGVIAPMELAIFERLLVILDIDPSLAKLVADSILASDPPPLPVGRNIPGPSGVGTTGSANNPPATTVTTVQSLRLTQVDDLSAIPGFTPEIVRKLAPHLAILFTTNLNRTPININTATPEVLAAVMNLTVAQATAVRKLKLYYLTDVEFKNDAQRMNPQFNNNANLSTTSDYYYVNGRVTLEQANWTVSALIQKSGPPSQVLTKVIWARED